MLHFSFESAVFKTIFELIPENSASAPINKRKANDAWNVAKMYEMVSYDLLVKVKTADEIEAMSNPENYTGKYAIFLKEPVLFVKTLPIRVEENEQCFKFALNDEDVKPIFQKAMLKVLGR